MMTDSPEVSSNPAERRVLGHHPRVALFTHGGQELVPSHEGGCAESAHEVPPAGLCVKLRLITQPSRP